MEATVILARCSKDRRAFGMRTQKMSDGDWWRMWAFPIDERRAHHEGYDTTEIRGSLKYAEGYPGCPYCGAMNFVRCGTCDKLTCYNNEVKLGCGWCGTLMTNITPVQEFTLTGGDV